MTERAVAGDEDLAVYLMRFLQKDIAPGQNPSRERLIKALPALCQGAAAGLKRAEAELEGRAEMGWGASAVWASQVLGLSRAASVWRDLPEGGDKEALGAYLKGLEGFDPQGRKNPPESAMETHGSHMMKGIRAFATMEEHLRRCAEAGVDPGLASEWALGPEESRAQVARLLERRSVEGACAPGRSGGAGGRRV